MGNNEWDNYLRDILGEFKSEGDLPHWDEFSEQLDSSNIPEDQANVLSDAHLKETLSTYTPENNVEGWDRIENSLNAEDQAFDENVRTKIKHYEPAFDPHSWPLFLQQFSANKLLRFKLIALKVAESMVLLLLILTAINISRQGKFPFESIQNESSTPPSTIAQLQPDISDPIEKVMVLQERSTNTLSAFTETATPNSSKKNSPSKGNRTSIKSTTTTAGLFQTTVNSTSTNVSSKVATDLENSYSALLPNAENVSLNFNSPETFNPTTSLQEDEAKETVNVETSATAIPALTLNESYITEALAISPSTVSGKSTPTVPLGKIALAKARKYFEFGMMAQVDYNQLKMPEDRLYSFGRTFVFPLQGITSPGYGAGFTLAIGHPNWAMETGLVYSAKTFKPGRKLTIGDENDNGSVEFDAMRLQLISVPLQFRYRFEPKGRLKAYALAGFGLHVIVQSDIDVEVKYNFASLSAGENPNNNVELAETIRKTKRITEDFKDGADFSTKSFISANLGLGLEYLIQENKTLFIQTAYQYQIPNLHFSNHNGKHILSLSLQAGVRTPLGT